MAPFAVGTAVRFFVRISGQNILQVAAPLRTRDDQRTSGNGFEMLVHDRGRTLDISRCQSGDDGAMFVDGALRRMRAAVQREDKAATRRQFADMAGQHWASGHLRKQNMEFRRKAYR